MLSNIFDSKSKSPIYKFNDTPLNNSIHYRITFEYKNKIHGNSVMLGYVVKLITLLDKNSNVKTIYEIVYQSEYWNLDLVNTHDVILDRIEKQSGNSIDVLESYINNISSRWFVEIKKIVDSSYNMSKLLFSTNPNSMKFSIK
jgi:hypothetical protein